MSARNTIKSIQDLMRQDIGVDGDAQRLSQLCWMLFLKIIDDQDQHLEQTRSPYQSPIPVELQWRTWAAHSDSMNGDALLEFINSELFPRLRSLPTHDQSNRAHVIRSVFEDANNYMKSGQLIRQVINKISSLDFNDLADRKHFGDIYEQLLNDLQNAGNAGEYYTPRAVTAFMVERIDPKPGEILFDPSCGTGGFLTCAIRHMQDRYVNNTEDEKVMESGLRAIEKKPLPHMLCMTNMLLHGIEDPSFVRHANTLARPFDSYGESDLVDIIVTNPPFGGREEDGIELNFPKEFQTKETADLFLALYIRLLKLGGRAAIVLPDGSLSGDGVKTRLKELLLNECNLHTVIRLPDSVFKPYANISTSLLFFEKGEPTKEIWFYEHQVPQGQKFYSMTKPIRIEHFQSIKDWWGGEERINRQESEVAWKIDFAGLLSDARVRAKPFWDEAEQFELQIKNNKATISNVRSEIRGLEKTFKTLDEKSDKRVETATQLASKKQQLETLIKDVARDEEKQKIARRAGDAIYDAAFNLDFKNPHIVVEEYLDPTELLAKLEQDEAHVASLRDQLKSILAEALLR